MSPSPPSPTESTLVDVLSTAVHTARGASLVSVHRDDSEHSLSYPQLMSRALGLLAALQAQGLRPGHHLISQTGSGARQIEVFWACVLGGIVPVLLPKVVSWRRDSEAARRLRAVCDLLAPATLLIDEDQQADHDAGQPALAPGIRWLVDPGEADPTLARQHPVRAGDLAYLQFSSGSTGLPKGVRLTHANIIANLRDMAQVNQLGPGDGFLNWMPYYHDMGLVTFHLLPTYLGASQVKLDAADFVADPLRWLDKIHRHRSAVVGCPNFGLRRVLDALDGRPPEGLDLSCVRLWINGAEPIWVPTLRGFSAGLAAAGLRPEAMVPAYGLAEATVGVSFSPRGTRALVHRLDRQALLHRGLACDAADGVEAIEYADAGIPLPSTQVRIAGEDGTDLGENRLGEIRIRGASVTAGLETADRGAQRDLFDAQGWLRTGDLGFLRNGRLTITGRLKDVIFINGRKLMAADVEQHLSEGFRLKTGRIAACGVTQDDGTEAVVLFVVARARNADWALLHAIRAAAADYLSHPVTCVLPVSRIPHTSSGKLQRYQLALQWKQGGFAALFHTFRAHRPTATASAPRGDLTTQGVVQAWAEALRLPVDDIDLDASFASLGGGSVEAMRMLRLLEVRLDRRLDTKILWECPTVRDIVAHLAPGLATAALASPAPVPARPAGPGPAPIAVIGMAGRFPGADSLAQYWRNLLDGVCSIGEVPAERWTIEGRQQRMGWLDGIDLFAADFFGVNEEEARVMDPQQRLMLEAGHEALEDAGYTGARMPASRNIGVYVGAIYSTYLEQITERRRLGGFAGAWHPQLLPANMLNVIAARIAQSLDLKGPAISIDTACSSSLAGLHYACADLRSGQCEMALVGGVCLLTSPSMVQLLDQAGTLSPQGTCRPFDEAADGLVVGEGLGLVVLKPLDKAVADGDRIDAVISATAINNDGRSIGIMAPTTEGQAAVVRQALAKADLRPDQLSYVETHGTGTPVGDAIELHALTAAFGEPTGPWSCGIGSVKSNIGHPMAAAGVAGLIKLLLALRHDRLPPTLNLREPLAPLRLAHTPLRPVLSATPWPRGAAARHAGISSFGFGGTNAHAIVSDGPALAAPDPAGRTHHLVCLSARNSEELLAVRARLREHLLEQADLPMAGLSYTTCVGREAFQRREYLVVSDRHDAIEQLEQGPRGRGPGTPPQAEALHALGARWACGEAIDWAAHFEGSGARIVPLPTYPFVRRSYWLRDAEPHLRTVPASPAVMPRGLTPEAASQVAVPRASGSSHDHVARLIEACLAAHHIHGAARGTPFASLGADSLIAMQTCDTLAARLGISVPLPLFFEHDSIDRLARHLVESNRAQIESLLQPATAEARC